MNSNDPWDIPLTASELLAGLEHDPKYLARLEELERHKRRAREDYDRAAAPLLQELAQAGLRLEVVADLVKNELYRNKANYEIAMPILLRWLPHIEYRHLKEDIIRTLSVPWAKSAVPVFLEQFQKLHDPEGTGLKWVIGNALEVLADDNIFDELVEIVRDKQHRRAREMVVLALAKMKNPQAVDVLIELLDDEEVAGNAVWALRKLGAKAAKARPYIEPFLTHPETWIRNEAKRAIAKMDKAKQRS